MNFAPYASQYALRCAHAKRGLVQHGGIDADEDVAFDDDMELVDLSARYTIEGMLGQGGMGEVLFAMDQRLKRKVAIKRVLGDKVRSRIALQRFLTEAQSVAALNHPNIVQIYDYGRDKSGPFLILEFVDGGSLLDLCRDGALPLEDAIRLTCQLCDGLEMAHAANIIHRDVKPANVLLTKSGMPKLTDFGLAKDESADSSHTLTGAVLGTLDFMPPEQRKDVALTDARSDLWSLAATLYQLVTGKTPKIIRLHTLPASLQDVLSQALEDNPDDRFQTAASLREALQACLKESGSRSVSDPSAAVDLEEGTCLACGTKNDLNRKFCRKCAVPLRVSCLACEVELPVWENICGGCGANQQQLATSRRSELDAQCAEAESLRSQYEFEKALKIAGEISLVTDIRLQHLRGWSESFLSETDAEQDRQIENANNHFAEAQSHRAAFDYPSAIHAMQSIPEVMRTFEMSRYLKHLIAEGDESQELIQTISQRVHRRDLDGLLESVNRALTLRGDRTDLRKLRAQLISRREQKQRQQNELKLLEAEQKIERELRELLEAEQSRRLQREYQEISQEAKDLLAMGEAKAAWQRLQAVPPIALPPSDIAFQNQLAEIVRQEDEISELVKAAKADGVLEPQEVVALLGKAIDYLYQNPRHERIIGLKQQLIERMRQFANEYSGNQLAVLPDDLLVTLPSVILARLPENVLLALAMDGFENFPMDVLVTLPPRIFATLANTHTKTLRGHNDEVNGVAFSPDGKKIASASRDNRVKVWDATSGQETLVLKGNNLKFNSVAYSPDGIHLASATDDGMVIAWDATSGQMTRNLYGHKDYGRGVAFSPDGTRIASPSSKNAVKVWDVTSGQEKLTLTGHADLVTSVAFSPDGKRIASGSADNTVKVWDAIKGRETITLKWHINGVRSVAFSPDANRLVSASRDWTVIVCDSLSGQEKIILKGHTKAVNCVAFSPDGKRIASASSDNTVIVWDAVTAREIITLCGHTGAVNSVAFSPDGKWLASASTDKTVKVWLLPLAIHK